MSSSKRLVERWFGCRIYHGWYPRGTNLSFDLTRVLGERPSVIIDVGANVGDTARSMAQKFPTATIHALEPVKSTFEALKTNVKEFSNIRCHQLAIGANNEVASINIYEGHSNNSLIESHDEGAIGVEEVVVQTLCQFCDDHKIQKIDYLKIDTEGFDLEVIKGAKPLFQQKSISTVLAELGFSKKNEKHVSFSEYNDFMYTQGMGIFGIYDQRREFDGSQLLRRADCLFVSSDHCLADLEHCPDV